MDTKTLKFLLRRPKKGSERHNRWDIKKRREIVKMAVESEPTLDTTEIARLTGLTDGQVSNDLYRMRYKRIQRDTLWEKNLWVWEYTEGFGPDFQPSRIAKKAGA